MITSYMDRGCRCGVASLSWLWVGRGGGLWVSRKGVYLVKRLEWWWWMGRWCWRWVCGWGWGCGCGLKGDFDGVVVDGCLFGLRFVMRLDSY